MSLSARFFRLHLLLIPCLLASLALLAQRSGLDLTLARLFYADAAHGFPMHDWPWLELFGHHLAKSAVTLIWLSLLAIAIISQYWRQWQPRLASRRPALWAAVAGMALGPLLVVWLKEINTHHCPWDLAGFGGSAAFSSDWFVSRAEAGHCFPGGHAASGFSLIALYFLARALDLPQARRWLWLALGAGCSFSLLRMAQGAHFLSHNLWAAAICWGLAAFSFKCASLFERGRFAAAYLSRSSDARQRMLLRIDAFLTGKAHGQQTETLILLTVLLILLFANAPFWQGLLAGRDWQEWATWRFAIASFVALAALHYLVIGLLATRLLLRPLLAVLLIVAMLAGYHIRRYGVVIDPAMLRNVLQTDWREARELLNPDLLLFMALALVPLFYLWRVRLVVRPPRQAVLVRGASLLLALLAGSAALLVSFQDFGSAMRSHKALRYQLTPGNVVWSLARLAVGTVHAQSVAPLAPVRRQPRPAGMPRKPMLLVMVVGETLRAANFGLNGYARMTTPELAGLPVINFPHVTACGTSTAVSLPCMFSAFGRADYDESKIRSHESLLQLLARAGYRVGWLDNQSGCKGVCDGLEFVDLGQRRDAGLCAGEHCLDEILLTGLREQLQADAEGRPIVDRVVVLHPLGNHGPAYHRRYPAAFARYRPACNDDDLGKCTRQEIVNAYDNAVLYTDHLLARLIAFLQTQAAERDVALLYVSDHGESLGEYGLFLHGVPQAIAPREQLEVPMLWWLPAATARRLQLDTACLRARSAGRYSHDNLYSSLLGLLEVQTPGYRRERDMLADCRRPGSVSISSAGLAGEAGRQ
ncbi:Putative membrane-associated, metal-dependent hydrolase (modular protein) [Sterolibacterium denitrificans]|uniref:Membrane-associated, metal-dependent hydrolase (Modular protein) n=1 Tax=Sterolibacterium denitrificans TaxID=157592 RepID=A0A7Z7MUD9_9PROT|nr:phosphoethanolamine--lipid A transferase [Sterolibacterium denitrificans]SMB22650.1 Putative membrane-associated, metal-dependent hydrolase (modular protein) [Sterolibacterium denitrificans]